LRRRGRGEGMEEEVIEKSVWSGVVKNKEGRKGEIVKV
jgi:hypothetical protein